MMRPSSSTVPVDAPSRWSNDRFSRTRTNTCRILSARLCVTGHPQRGPLMFAPAWTCSSRSDKLGRQSSPMEKIRGRPGHRSAYIRASLPQRKPALIYTFTRTSSRQPMSTGGGLDLRLRKAFGEERRPLVRQRRGVGPVEVEVAADRDHVARPLRGEQRGARRRLVQQQEVRPGRGEVLDAVHGAGHRGHTRAGGHEALSRLQIGGHAEFGTQLREGRVVWPRGHPGRDDGACLLSREMRTVQAQVFEEDPPAGAQAVVVSVPLFARAEAAVDQPDHAGAPVARLHQPLLCERRLTLAGEHHAVRWLPGGDPRKRLTEAGAEVHAYDAALVLLHLMRNEPGGDYGSGGDGLPHLFRRSRDLYGQIDNALLIAGLLTHGSGSLPR